MPATKINYGADSEWSCEAEAMIFHVRRALRRFEQIEATESAGYPNDALIHLYIAECALGQIARYTADLRERFAEQYGLDDAHLTATIRSIGGIGR